MRRILALGCLALCLFAGCDRGGSSAPGSAGEANSPKKPVVLRVGHFPDIVHAQALVGRARGDFEKAMGPDVKIEWQLFNAGPSAIEALYAGELDMCYIGPNPSITGYLTSEGTALHIVAGAASGGAGLVVRKDAGIKELKDFHGKRIATPQIGNTQDVACRAWLKANGLATIEENGDVQVMPVKNPDQLTLMLQKQLDAAWTKEPWVARLTQEADCELFLDERTLWPDGRFATAGLIAGADFMKQHPDLLKKWLTAHVEITLWVNDNLEESEAMISKQIEELTSKGVPMKVLQEAFSRTEVTYDPCASSITQSAKSAAEAGYLKMKFMDLSGLVDLTTLNEVLAEKGMAPIK